MAENSKTAGALFQSFGLAALIAVVILIIFQILRHFMKKLYMPRCFAEVYSWDPNNRRKFKIKHPPNPDEWTRFFGTSWIWKSLRYPLSKLKDEKGGYDALMYLAFIRYSMIFFTILAFFGFTILVPINATGENKDLSSSNEEYVSGLDEITLSNIPQNSGKLWAHLVATYAVTIGTMLFLYFFVREYVDLSIAQSKKDGIKYRTVMVTNLPKEYTISDEALTNKFKEMYGDDKVQSGIMVKDATKLRKLQKKRQTLVDKYKESYLHYLQTNERPQHKEGRIPYRKKVVDSLDHYSKEIENLDEQIFQLIPFSDKEERKNSYGTMEDEESERLQEQDQSVEKNQSGLHKGLSMVTKNLRKVIGNINTGFVSFYSMQTAIQCSQSVHHKKPRKLVTVMAPDPTDVAWYWLPTKNTSIFIRKLIAIVLLILLFLFWSIPVTFISAFTTLETISQVDAFDFLIDFLDYSPFVKNLVQGFLPSLALVIFMALLPIILRVILNQRAFPTFSQLDNAVMITYWTFLLLNIFLVTTIAGSIFGVLEEFVDDPGSIVELLATSLPAQSIFFTQYIIVLGFSSVPLLLLRIGPLLKYLLKKMGKRDEEQKNRQCFPEPFPYHTIWASASLVFCIALSYSVMSPIILPFAVIYFFVNYVVAKYSFIIVKIPIYDGIKTMTRYVVNIVVISMLIFQATMGGILGLKLFEPGVAIFPLLIVTVWFRIYLRKYTRPASIIPISECPPEKTTQTRKKSADNTYKDPALEMPPSLETIQNEVKQRIDDSQKTSDSKYSSP